MNTIVLTMPDNYYRKVQEYAGNLWRMGKQPKMKGEAK